MNTEIDFLKDIIKRLDLYFVECEESGKIRAISGGLMRLLGYDPTNSSNLNMKDLLPENAFNDLLGRRYSMWQNGLRFYRTQLLCQSGDILLFDVSGYMETDPTGSRYKIMVRELGPLDLGIETGPFLENVHAYSVARKYIAPDLMRRARIAAKTGQKQLLSENNHLTFLFADLVGFTAYSENRNPDEIVQMLNLSIGAASSNIIHYGGRVDKIMGDSVFAIFDEPLKAILAAIEMQKQFQILNLFNLKSDLPEVQVRVGIHSGDCIQASLGTEDHLEWTAIGDAVNTASRLEKASTAGGILVSAVTIDMVKESVTTVKEVEVAAKGKAEPVKAFYINRVTFQGPRGPISLGVDDDVF